MPPPKKKKTFKEMTHVTRERIAAALHSRFWLRFHTSILLLWTFCAGLLTTKGLFALGMQSMFWRYTIAIVVAYGAFLLGVRLWLHYVGAGAARKVNNARSMTMRGRWIARTGRWTFLICRSLVAVLPAAARRAGLAGAGGVPAAAGRVAALIRAPCRRRINWWRIVCGCPPRAAAEAATAAFLAMSAARWVMWWATSAAGMRAVA